MLRLTPLDDSQFSKEDAKEVNLAKGFIAFINHTISIINDFQVFRIVKHREKAKEVLAKGKEKNTIQSYRAATDALALPEKERKDHLAREEYQNFVDCSVKELANKLKVKAQLLLTRHVNQDKKMAAFKKLEDIAKEIQTYKSVMSLTVTDLAVVAQVLDLSIETTENGLSKYDNQLSAELQSAIGEKLKELKAFREPMVAAMKKHTVKEASDLFSSRLGDLTTSTLECANNFSVVPGGNDEVRSDLIGRFVNQINSVLIKDLGILEENSPFHKPEQATQSLTALLELPEMFVDDDENDSMAQDAWNYLCGWLYPETKKTVDDYFSEYIAPWLHS